MSNELSFVGFYRDAMNSVEQYQIDPYWILRHLDESHEDSQPSPEAKAAFAFAVAIKSMAASGGSHINSDLVQQVLSAGSIAELRQLKDSL